MPEGGIDVLEGIGFTGKDGKRYIRDIRDADDAWPRAVGQGFRKVAATPSREAYCKPALVRAKLESAGALFVFNWCKFVQKKHFTVADVLKMKVGDSVELLFMDRNLFDYVTNPVFNEPNVAIEPTRFFETNKVTFKKTARVVARLNEPLAGQLKQDTLGDEESMRFSRYSFQLLNIEEGYWGPLDKHGFYTNKLNHKKHWSEFTRDTPVGNRGYAIPWEVLDDMPHFRDFFSGFLFGISFRDFFSGCRLRRHPKRNEGLRRRLRRGEPSLGEKGGRA